MSPNRFQQLVSTVESYIESAGSRDFREVLKKYNYLGETIEIEVGTIKGFATHHGNMPIIAIHAMYNDTFMYQFAGWHELTHILDGDVGRGSNHSMRDLNFCQRDVYDKSIPENEHKCNLISSYVNVDTENALDMICYNSQSMKEFRELKEALKKAKQKSWNIMDSIDRWNPSQTSIARLKSIKRDIESMSKELEALHYELMDMDAFKSFSDMANEMGVPAKILKYKFEALRLLDYDINPQELEDYGTLFDDIADSYRY